MNNTLSSVWQQVSLLEIRLGATYQGIVYDQDLIVEMVDGTILTLFDMATKIALDVKPGAIIEVIIAISTPANLTLENKNRNVNFAVVDSIDFEPPRNDVGDFRKELFERVWCALRAPQGYFLMSRNEITSILSQQVSVGDTLFWDDARLDLMAWRPVQE